MASFSNHIFFSFLFGMIAFAAAQDRSFDQNYYPYWGFNNFKHLQDGDDEVQLVLDHASGAGFKSRMEFGSGRFHMNMMIPKERSQGVLPNFYLISNNPSSAPHSELDFEFMGTDRRIMQTNIFADDKGGRERRFKLWFDPSEDFHSYTILWNNHQIVFFVDDVPVTVYKNQSDIGAHFPVGPLHIEATIWDGSAWAGPVNWTAAPFTTYYRNFTITGCQYDNSDSGKCDSAEFEWNDPSQWDLSPPQEELLENYSQFLSYDYCHGKDAASYPECNAVGT